MPKARVIEAFEEIIELINSELLESSVSYISEWIEGTLLPEFMPTEEEIKDEFIRAWAAKVVVDMIMAKIRSVNEVTEIPDKLLLEYISQD